MELLAYAIALAAGLLVTRVGLPPLVGYLAAGFALALTGIAASDTLHAIGDAGVKLLLFAAGLKVRPRDLWAPDVIGAGLLQLLAGGLLAALLLAASGLPARTTFTLGVLLTFASTVYAAKTLDERGELGADHGRIAIGILLLQDVVAVALLAAADGATPHPASLALLALPLLVPVLRRALGLVGHDELLLLVGFVLTFGGAALFGALGVGDKLGALVAGFLLAGHPRAEELAKQLWAPREAGLVAFFLGVGLMGVPPMAMAPWVLAGLAFLPLRTLAGWLLLRAVRVPVRTATWATATLGTYSEFCLIAATGLAAAGWLPRESVPVLALIVALSLAIGPPQQRLIEQRLAPRLAPPAAAVPFAERLRPEAIVVGMGRTGSAAYDMLRQRAMDVVGVDPDLNVVQRHRERGRRVLHADAEDLGFWNTVELAGVQAILCCLPNAETKLDVAKLLAARGFAGRLGATALYDDEAIRLAEGGYYWLVQPFREAGTQLAAFAAETGSGGGGMRLPTV